MTAPDGIGGPSDVQHGTIGEGAGVSFSFWGETLGMQRPIEPIGFRRAKKGPGLLSATEATGPVPGCQRRHLVKEEQRCVAAAHWLVVQALVMQFAGDPVMAGPSAGSESPVVPVKAPATIAHQRAAFRRCDNFAPGIDAVLQAHGLRGGVSEQPAVPKGLAMSQPAARRMSCAMAWGRSPQVTRAMRFFLRQTSTPASPPMPNTRYT